MTSLKKEFDDKFGINHYDMTIFDEEEKFKVSEEYNIVQKYTLKKYMKKYRTPTPPKKPKVRINPEEITSFNVQHLQDDLYLAELEDLVIKDDGKRSYCAGFYDRETKEILPLTEEKKEFCRSLEIKTL